MHVGPGTVESDPSNTINYLVHKVGKIKTGAEIEEFVYELDKNYPNPFNQSQLSTTKFKRMDM
ncbi:MAG: hypothetical protein Q8M94_14170 [Ignavibacteria bacterium]|nr:hypothetical protein [Ignavibacteria bacterium]